MTINGKNLSNVELHHMCIENGWFTAGTNEQYDKLFRLNERESKDTFTTLFAVIMVIWVCSEKEIGEIEEKTHGIFQSERSVKQWIVL